MILFLADGRLGNQLFQYAFLNAISDKGEYIICTAMDEFEANFELKNKNYKNIRVNRPLRFLINSCLPFFLRLLSQVRLVSYVEQVRVNGVPSINVKIVKGILPVKFVKTGFFQSESFFNDEDIEFELKSIYKEKASSIFDSLPIATTKIFVHVRRGDYLFEDYRGVRGFNLPREYYFNSIALLNRKVENPYYIFLTDDPEYVDCCFQHIKNKYISEESMAVDLALMSLCDYGIAANSSFSWWGAYLMEKRQAIFPKYWYGWKHRVESHPEIQPRWGVLMDVPITNKEDK